MEFFNEILTHDHEKIKIENRTCNEQKCTKQ